MDADTQSVPVLNALMRSSKGKLLYDRYWYDDGRLEEVIQECASPPSLSSHVLELNDENNASHHTNSSLTRQSSEQENGYDDEKLFTVIGGQRPQQNTRNPEQKHRTPMAAYYEKALSTVEQEWSNKAKVSVDERKQRFKEHSQHLEEQAKKQLVELYLRREEEATMQDKLAWQQERARVEEVKKSQQELRKRHIRHHQLLNEKLQEGNRELRQKEEENKRRQLEAQQRLTIAVQLQNDVRQMREQAVNTLKACTYKQHLPQDLPTTLEELTREGTSVDNIVQLMKESPENGNKRLTRISAHAKKAQVHLEFITQNVDQANKKGSIEAAKQQQLEQEKAAAEKAKLAQEAAEKAKADAAQSTTAVSSTSTGGGDASSDNRNNPLAQCVSEQRLAFYEDLQKKLKQAEASVTSITGDPQLKKLKFDLQKAVNTTINAISPTSGSHLRDKMLRLAKLMSGQSLEVGGKSINPSVHPNGILFCKQLFAKKIVKQGDEQVSANHDSAFAIAWVTVGIWQLFPDVGDLLLANFHQKCPYLVPYYLPKSDGQSSEDYYKSLGYNYDDDGNIEKQDKFLRRMSGMMRLYAAMIISEPPQAQTPHPHGSQAGWMWLTHFVNLPPRPDITATLLYDFLQVVGCSFMRTYGKQFRKLLELIHKHYMPKVKAVTPKGAGGPVTRLESFLEKAVMSGRIDSPKGILDNRFWMS